ncbi:protein of unknown function [Hyphomicrobium sp. MC1]|nr:protein of unknown function [Hyphomicrobium sp. MC1]
MEASLLRIIALCRKIQKTPDEVLRELDRVSLIVVREELLRLQREIEAIVSRLKFIDAPDQTTTSRH